ncbi:MAG: lipopolysaccharide biosynthesis protein [Candidatus Binataceae bacterium]
MTEPTPGATDREALKLGRNITWSYLAHLATTCLPLLTVPFYVRLLGHDLYGQWLVIVSITSYLGLANLGMGQTLINRIAAAVALNKRDKVAELASTGFFAYLGIGLLVISAVGVAAPWVTDSLARASANSALAAFAIYFGFLVVSFPLRTFSGALQALERVDLERKINIYWEIVRALTVIGALYAGFRLVAIAAIIGALTTLSSLNVAAIAMRILPELRPRISYFSRSLLRDLVKPSAAFLGVQIGTTLIFAVDNIVIGYSLGAAAVTRYAVPFRLTMAAAALFSVGLVALTPTITANYTRGQAAVLETGFVFAARLALLYGTVAAVMLWLIGPHFIDLWAGRGVFPGHATYALQVLFFLLSLASSVPATILWATTRHYAWSALAVFEGILNLALSLWWVRHWGLAGVIAATVTASLLTNAWYLPFAGLRALGPGARDAAVQLIRPCAIALAVLILTFVVWSAIRPASLVQLTLVAALATFTAVAAFATLVFTREEREAGRSWILRMVRAGAEAA